LRGSRLFRIFRVGHETVRDFEPTEYRNIFERTAVLSGRCSRQVTYVVTEFLAHLLVTAALLLVVANLVEGIQIEGWSSAILGALVLGLANACVRPLMIVLTLPLTVLTFGLFLLVVNGVTLQLAAALTPGIKVSGCGVAIIGGIVLALLNVAIAMLIGPAV